MYNTSHFPQLAPSLEVELILWKAIVLQAGVFTAFGRSTQEHVRPEFGRCPLDGKPLKVMDRQQ